VPSVCEALIDNRPEPSNNPKLALAPPVSGSECRVLSLSDRASLHSAQHIVVSIGSNQLSERKEKNTTPYVENL
jgi:hypothetical protein